MSDDLGTALILTQAWLKAGHVVFVIFWIAGLFMLPRFYVYHQETKPGSAEEQSWIERERRLVRIILGPSVVLAWLLGLALAYSSGAWSQGWFVAKLALVLGLTGFHLWLIGYGRRLAAGARPLGIKRLRALNELPGLFVLLIVVLVIVRPF